MKTQTAYTKGIAKVTAQLLTMLDQDCVPWQKSWVSVGMPRNCEGRQYSGGNLMILGITSIFKRHSSPYWLTFKQAKKFGGHVRKGEKGTAIIGPRTGKSKNQFDEDGNPARYTYFTAFAVFNADQIDDLPADALPPLPEAPCGADAVQVFDDMLAAYPNPPKRGKGEPAFSPKNDTVYMPDISAFTATEGYYSTLAHEHIHSTGHPDRLARFAIDCNQSNQEEYSFEELIAEIGACFLMNHVGMEPTYENSAGYIDNWRKYLTENSTHFIQAASAAQKAVDHIIGESP